MRRKFLKLICISLLGLILVPHRYLYSQTKKIINQNLTKEQKDILFNLIQKKPITPSDDEVTENPPSRSAKFRYVIKKTDFYNFDTDIEEKFRNYIEIENYGDKF